MLNNNFFKKTRTSLFNGQLSQSQVDSLNAIFKAWKEIDGKDIELLSYGLATTYHEVGPKLQPISENLNYSAKRITEVWPSRFKTIAAAQPYANNPEKLANNVYGGRLGNNKTGDGWKYRGRGFPQTTGKVNYEKFAKILNIDLVNKPELAMNPEVAAKILIIGLRDGLFTGKKVSDYSSFEKMRPTVNADGSRKTRNGASTVAKDIASYAYKFKDALNGGISNTVTAPIQSGKSIIQIIIELITKLMRGRK